MELILHIGQQKTGSTALQTFLNEKYEILSDYNILYPQSLGNEHNKQHLLIYYSKLSVLNDQFSLKSCFLREIEKKSPNKVIISEENMFRGKEKNLEQLKVFIDGIFHNIKIICYLRVQHDHMPSNYQQGLKGTVSKDLRTWLNTHIYKSEYYKYLNVLRRWQKAFPHAEIIVKTVKNLKDGDICKDFCNLTIPEVSDKLSFTPNNERNKKMDMAGAQLLYYLNKIIESNPHPDFYKTIKNEIILSQDVWKSKVPYSFTNKITMEIWNHFKESNAKISSEFKLSQEDINYLTSRPELNDDIRADYTDDVYFRFLENIVKRSNS